MKERLVDSNSAVKSKRKSVRLSEIRKEAIDNRSNIIANREKEAIIREIDFRLGNQKSKKSNLIYFLENKDRYKNNQNRDSLSKIQKSNIRLTYNSNNGETIRNGSHLVKLMDLPASVREKAIAIVSPEDEKVMKVKTRKPCIPKDNITFNQDIYEESVSVLKNKQKENIPKINDNHIKSCVTLNYLASLYYDYGKY